jgi:Flp pilus assembly protein TadD
VLTAGAAALAVISLIVWRRRRASAAPAAAWFGYLVLLLPVAGLLPSGVQATADRYLYVPSMVCALVAAILVSQLATSKPRALLAAAAAVCVVFAFTALTRRQVGYWHDSVALWSRAIELDPRNDVALYNLAVGLAEQGRDDEAMQRYEQTVALVPDHDLARRELAKLKERRVRTESTEGLSLLRQGRFGEAATRLRAAVDAGAHDTNTTNALAYALVQSGRTRDAVAVLSRASTEHPDDVNLKHNLARMLATAEDSSVRDPQRAVVLAKDVCASTGNRDPRALDTLALAYAASGQRDVARATARQAAALARQMGDEDTAAAIDMHAAAFGK